jgi:VanZ family protein
MSSNRYNWKKPNVIRIIWIMVLIGWMALIFIKSNEPYQAQDIRPYLTEWFPPSSINNWLPHLEFYFSGQLLTWKEPYVLLEFIIRKSAHVTEYAVLTWLWLVNIQATALKRYTFIISPVMVMVYAASDEWHQSFITGRTGHAIDVAVDSIGMLIVMLVWLAWSWRNSNRNRNRNRKRNRNRGE